MTKKLLITGANRGIGLELAKFFKQNNYEIYALVRHSSAALDEISTQTIKHIDFSNMFLLKLL